MTVLTILAVILSIVLITYLSIRINVYSEEVYEYEPFNLGITAIVAGAFIILLIGVMFVPDGASMSEIVNTEKLLSASNEHLDSVVCFALFLIILLGVWIRLISKTNFLIATYVLVIQLMFSLVLVIGLLLIFTSRKGK